MEPCSSADDPPRRALGTRDAFGRGACLGRESLAARGGGFAGLGVQGRSAFGLKGDWLSSLDGTDDELGDDDSLPVQERNHRARSETTSSVVVFIIFPSAIPRVGPRGFHRELKDTFT